MQISRIAFRFGCLVSLAGPILAILLYPRANWLFALILIGLTAVLLQDVLASDPPPGRLADEIEQLLAGSCYGYAVDDFEHQRIRNPQVRELWQRSMKVGGPAQEWVRLDEGNKDQLRAIIRKLRELD